MQYKEDGCKAGGYTANSCKDDKVTLVPRHSIVLTRLVNASASGVYAAWTVPAAMERWLGQVSAEVRIGACYRIESPAERGGTYVYTGKYLILEPDRRVVQTFLAGIADPEIPNPYSNEFIEIRLLEISPAQTELTFVNGWDGEALDEEGLAAASAAWSGWLERMERSL